MKIKIKTMHECVKQYHIYRAFEVKLKHSFGIADEMEQYGWTLIEFVCHKHWLFFWRETVYMVFMIDKEEAKRRLKKPGTNAPG